MSSYILELVIIHSVLILAYWLFLRKERQYGKMRFFLIVSTVLSLVIPMLRLPQIFSVKQQPIQELTIQFMNQNPTVLIAGEISPSFDYAQLLVWISLLGTTILLIKLTRSIMALMSMASRGMGGTFNGVEIKRLKEIKGSFTFFNWIFLSDDVQETQLDYTYILKHEAAHVRLGHSYDLMFFEVYKAFFWWLPSSWYINSEIRKLHEYQADSYALKTTHVDLYSSILINSILQSHGLSMASSFHEGLIFKRLKAMKQKASKVSNWKVGLLTVLCAFLFVTFACSEEKTQAEDVRTSNDAAQTQRKEFTKVEEQATYEGGMDVFYKYVMSEMRYPAAARNKGVEGTVDVQFVIERDGSVSNVKALNSIGAGCDEEAIRVVKGAQGFKAASQRGRTVKVAMVMPITFKLNPEKRNPDNSAQGSIIMGQATTSEQELKVEAHYNNGKWSGTIMSHEGDKLPGVNIVVAGTNYGTVSDLDGTFSVKATGDQELHISFVGYKPVVMK